MINLKKYINEIDFINNAPLTEKMQVAYYLNTGKKENLSYFTGLIKEIDNILKENLTFIFRLLLKDFTIDLRGLITFNIGIGKQFNIFTFETQLNNTFKHYCNPDYYAYFMNAGKQFRKLF
jgi:hypothetical protein